MQDGSRDGSLPATSHGIEALIDRLRREGVEEGRAEAERMIAEAETRARETLERAEREAAAMLDEAEREAARHHRAGEDALRIAMRDTILELTEALSQQFAEQVGRTVSRAMQDEETVKRLILAVARRAREESGMDAAREIEIALPRAVVGLDELRRRPEELREGSLTHFVAAEAAAMLRAGVRYSRSEDAGDGIRVTLTDEGVVVDLSDRAVADVLLRHLQPRFRALLESVVS